MRLLYDSAWWLRCLSERGCMGSWKKRNRLIYNYRSFRPLPLPRLLSMPPPSPSMAICIRPWATEPGRLAVHPTVV